MTPHVNNCDTLTMPDKPNNPATRGVLSLRPPANPAHGFTATRRAAAGHTPLRGLARLRHTGVAGQLFGLPSFLASA